MKPFLEGFAILVVVDFVVIAVLFIGNAYHERKYQRHERKYQRSKSAQPDLDDIIALFSTESEADEVQAVSGYVLELNATEANVLRLGDNGIVTAITLLGPAENAADAETLAGICGWQTASEWADGETAFASIVPKPISVAFVGTSEILPDDAVRMARNAGVEVVDYISQRVEEAEGKTYISFSVDKPRGWVDSEIPAYA